MRRSVLTAVLLALFVPPVVSPALAVEGMNLRWSGCAVSGGTSNRQFACDTNTGQELLYVSLVLDTPLASVQSIEASIDINPAGGVMPGWWQLRSAGTCRQNALGVALGQGAESPGCLNAMDWDHLASGGIAGYSSVIVAGSPAYRRLEFVVGVPDFDAPTLPAGQEIFVTRFSISHAKTVGTDACGGCDAPVCLGLHKIKLVPVNATGIRQLYTETFPGSSTVSWQGASAGSVVDPELHGNDPGPDRMVTCAAAVPARNRTWGTLKSLYR